ncbi:MAG: bifunctional 23S rRNA (guanine(2069)-N(7))-methyltransferase RlmK/23S rRNA (guanine(2445)-N(2))-methyltransferase RlmL [Myxococcales bacterium]|nr:bifunctional 23S rRNA (guanine(2069)-N(7))-methyltransferase RlmK/23S rRNA (guanine(2445)-N(2))-methyltransferase RlmL [Myxococcales bacterium]
MPAFFATTAKGMESLLVAELSALGAGSVGERRAGASFEGDLAIAYRACLWSRVANRILLPIGDFPAPDEEALYVGARAIRWTEHLGAKETLAVDFSTTRSKITHSHFGALRTKDAIVDQLREELGDRPSVNTENPDLRINVYLLDDHATVSIDLSGDSLHRRGYRDLSSLGGGGAPLKENLAAAILLLAGWPERARQGAPFLDPMCGSGTLPIEAALCAADIAPGLRRERFGFHGWRGHQGDVWRELVDEAKAREIRDPKRLPPIVGHDADTRAVHAALENVERAGLRGRVHIERRDLAACRPIPPRHGDAPGLLVVNPPYDERMPASESLYESIGDLLRREFPGWTGCVFTGNPDLARRIGLRPARRHVLWNGAIECRLLEFPISTAPARAAPRWRTEAEAIAAAPYRPSPASDAFANRVRKNLRHLRKWAAREAVQCYRVYDADLPEYSVAVDLYERSAHVQEYACPPTVDAERAEERLRDMMALLPGLIEVAPEEIFLKVRRRQRGGSQYEKQGEAQAIREVHEGGRRFLVNLSDYLDTGLFLDHRRLRGAIAEQAKGKRFLNLFAYTGSATVYAATAGARSTTSVDLSNTYLEWAEKNLALNDVRGPAHQLVRADCTSWIAAERERYDLIFLAPPTYSKSKSMDGDLDLQRDHPSLLCATARLLAPGGVLLFSCHFRKFKIERDSLTEAGLQVEEITRATIPKDFARDPRFHASWRITQR